MSNFAFLRPEWPTLFEAATKAEDATNSDPRAACFYARRTLEQAVLWLYEHDSALKFPYQRELSALIHEPSFKRAAGETVFVKSRVIKDLGNLSVHGAGTIRPADSLTAVRELFHVMFWVAYTYARGPRPPARLTFDSGLIPASTGVAPRTQEQLQKLEAELDSSRARLEELLSGKAALDAELQALREEVAAAKAANAAQPDTHDYSEAETRDFFIDLLLRESGWPLDRPEEREFAVTGMPGPSGAGAVDYVLWGDDGRPLGLVEAKRTKRDARAGQQQAKLYADSLERQFGQRPVIFYSNGYEHHIWDDTNYPPREVQGFYKKDELELLIQRRTTRQPLGGTSIDPAIVERYYQTRAIRRIGEAFETDHDRKTLLVMATGAGKTRTVIALCDMLMRANWAKRVLFLADRVALVNQAVNAFKRHLPGASPVNLVTEKDTEGRVYVSTYPTMMGLIDETSGGERKFGVGHFDVIVIDEAHRSVYQKYGAIFEYFDSLLVGLTATPKDEIDRNTYRLFGLESGVPTDAYGLEDAVNDGFLVPARAVSVPVRFARDGIRYADLSEEEREQWDELDWDEHGGVPDRVAADAVNSWLFNKDTVDKVLEHLMTRGQRVADGERLGKTIVFAKNHAHATFIADRFNANYPQYKGEFARVIDVQVDYAQTLIDSFSVPEKAPHIAISVDMLDTGIDIPEVVNLVFFKLVRSKTKFWQMVGRGTRLSPDLFGPGRDKQFFYIFDYCQNLEFFSQDLPASEGAVGQSLGKRLFTARLELIAELDRQAPAAALTLREQPASYDEWSSPSDLREETAEFLRVQVAAMNPDNFLVRPKRRLVEQYAQPGPWVGLAPEQAAEVAQLAGLPTQIIDDDLDAKRFDLLMLRLQLALLRSEASFTALRDQVREMAGILQEKSNIPMVREQLPLIQEVQTDEFWQDVTVVLLERVRKRLRALVKLIERTRRTVVFADFEDELGPESMMALPGFGSGAEFERFRAKARSFLQAHEDHLSVLKLRLNEPLTPNDLDDLEELLIEAGGSVADVQRASDEHKGLGLFIRSMVGLDRDIAKQAFGAFLAGTTQNADQIEFVNIIIDHLSEHGFMDPRMLYASPFTDISPRGPDGVFTSPQVDRLLSILGEIRARAAA